jgi:hypothetical protein
MLDSLISLGKFSFAVFCLMSGAYVIGWVIPEEIRAFIFKGVIYFIGIGLVIAIIGSVLSLFL